MTSRTMMSTRMASRSMARVWHGSILGLTITVCLWMVACGGDDDAAPGLSSSADGGTASYFDSGSYLPPSGSADAGAMADASAPWQEPIPEEDVGKYVENDWVETASEPVSTFSIDVDTASYSLMRQELSMGLLPDPDSVRVEEYINYFHYDYPQPTEGPFSINMEAAPSYFGEGYHLLRIGLQGLILPESERKQANLIFLIDVSGSMSDSNKLPLVKTALGYLVEHLEPTDTLGIVTYSSNVQVLLEPTPINSKAVIINAINALYASGSTAGGPGLQEAYSQAASAFIAGGINRVIICTDGDFNVGLSGQALISYVEQKRDEGVTLSVLGFGMGNYKDTFLEDLSNKGNGNYAYIDSEQEAQKVFGDKLLGTLQVIAKDVKVQMEFNPAAVLKYRLVGYENRLLNKQDFTDDTKDAGEIGAGHSVTAFYEIEVVEGLAPAEVLATTRFRYKEPEGTVSQELTRVIRKQEMGMQFSDASSDFRFAAAVVEYAEILRLSKHSQGDRFAEVQSIASATVGDDPDRLELVSLVGQAESLWSAWP